MKPQDSKRLPPSLAALGEALNTLRAPTGPFDPAGEWEHRYSVWTLVPAPLGGGETQNPGGALRVRRKPGPGGTILLDVTLATMQSGRAVCITRASITCADDRLATPQKWELRNEILDRDGRLAAETQVREVGEVVGATIRRRGQVERSVPAPQRFTSNWSLFEAVQRLPGDAMEPLAFDMFEDMDLHKPDQRLRFDQVATVTLADGPTRLHGFVQLGRGILPYHYWLDDQRRLLVAVGSLRAFIFDPAARLPGEEK